MGIFSIFNKKKQSPSIDFSKIGTDVHSHFIPAIDDGSENMEMSMQMLRSMADMGYRKVITTPHIMGDFFQNTREIILSGLELVKDQMEESGIELEIEAAAEYYLDFDFPNKLSAGNLMTFGKNYLLFELSYLNPPDGLNQLIFEMQTRGYKPVLAHPERYPFYYRDPEIYREIREKGALLQININSLSGHYSPDAKRIAMWLIDHNLVDFAGSDCHHPGHQQLMLRAAKEPAFHKLVDSGRLLNSTL